MPALVFQNVLVSYYEMRGPRMGLFVVGPPLRPATRPDSPPGRGAQMSPNLFKNILFDQISMCCWARILAQIAPNPYNNVPFWSLLGRFGVKYPKRGARIITQDRLLAFGVPKSIGLARASST